MTETTAVSTRFDRRACHACSHPRVDELNAALMDQVPVAHLTRQFALSRDSIYRHHKNHLRPALAADLVASPEVRPVALVARITSIANNARAASASAYRAGNAWLGARLGDSELKALSTLSERFGIDHDAIAADYASAAADYKQARVFALAMDRVIEAHPELGPELADAMETEGAAELAERLRNNRPDVSGKGVTP